MATVQKLHSGRSELSVLIVKEKDLTRRSLSFIAEEGNQNYFIGTIEIPDFNEEILTEYTNQAFNFLL